jgi:hypothetical protein
MRTLFVIVAALLCVTPAFAVQHVCYSWEDGGTVLCTYGSNLVGVANVCGPQNGVYGTGSASPGGSTAFVCPGACEGNCYLHVAEDPHTGTPSVVIAWIKGLQIGDTIWANVCLYDPFEGNSTFPGQRIYGAYTSCTDPCVYEAAATNPSTYTNGNPASWNSGTAATSWTWTYQDATEPTGCFRVEVRQYSTPPTANPQHTDFFIDYVCVEVPDYCEVIFPQGQSPVESSTWGVIKALYR